MGGSALIIQGTPSPELLTPRAAPQSFLSKLFGKRANQAPTEHAMGGDHALIEIPSTPLQALADDLRAFIADSCTPPWAATQYIIDYLADRRTITVYVRGNRKGAAPPEWYVQVSFSAAAGMCDTSAEVAAHWAEMWYQRRGAELASKYFLPFGFTPERVDADPQAAFFVPLGRAGYGLFYDPNDPTLASDDGHPFEIDYAVLEIFADDDLTGDWQELEGALEDLRRARKCWCQFCAPTLDLARFDRLALVQRMQAD